MSQTTKKLSRRDALKVLGAAAGATALANLPAKWTTPKLEAGVLPAHAATSCGVGLVLTLSPFFLFDLVEGPTPTGSTNPYSWDTSQCGCLAFTVWNPGGVLRGGSYSIGGGSPVPFSFTGPAYHFFIFNLTEGKVCHDPIPDTVNTCAAAFGCGPYFLV
jgi:hypothetical protein